MQTVTIRPKLRYSQLNVIQKINVKANAREYGARFTGIPKDWKGMNIAMMDLAQLLYDHPFHYGVCQSWY